MPTLLYLLAQPKSRNVHVEHALSSMRCGAQMIGQMSASRRTCIPCGVKTGFYYGGQKLRASFSVCEKCNAIKSPHSGMRHDPDTLEMLPKSLPRRYNVSADDDYGRSPKIGLEDYWWWTYSHMCAICVGEAGYTMEQVLNAEPRKDALQTRMKERYRLSMLASLAKQRERGRQIRASMGEPEHWSAQSIESMKLDNNPFPNFQPRPFIPNFEAQDYEAGWNQAILDHISGETSRVQIEARKNRRANAGNRRHLVAGPK
ncbi:hypothetical protein PMIN07_000880 [Paraphaeosphaeria minitans]|uniref:Uncharacterized protein n=1 Tax=Paraphaeosphaeria minitans TaxID=565426 RepID=A0A9P6GMU0_9PLEO|nr:hypothetical protein PMIN01_05049 [Paraphaeosphaeria minitans]